VSGYPTRLFAAANCSNWAFCSSLNVIEIVSADAPTDCLEHGVEPFADIRERAGGVIASPA